MNFFAFQTKRIVISRERKIVYTYNKYFLYKAVNLDMHFKSHTHYWSIKR